MTTTHELRQRWEQLERELAHGSPTVSREMALATLGRRGLNAQLRSGALTRLLPGTYCLSERAQDHVTLCHGLSAWSGGKVLVGGRSALYLANSAIRPPVKVHAVADVHEHVRAPSWVQIRHLGLPAWRGKSQGIDHLTVEDATVDAWHRAGRSIRERLCYEVLWRRIATASQIERASRRYPRVAGREELERLLSDFTDGAESPTEVIARRTVFRGKAFADLEWQAELPVAGRKRRADALHRRARMVIEFDGAEFHAGVQEWRRDRRRDAEFAAAGFVTLRFSYRDLISRPQWCRDQTLAALSHRVPRT